MYKGVMDEARCGVTSQLVNGCAAHASRRLLTRHLKTCSLVTLFTTYLIIRLRIVGLKSALSLGFLLWVGFPVVLLVGSVASDKVPLALAAIHGGDWLIKLLLMTVILVVWPSKKEKHKVPVSNARAEV